MLQQLKLNWRNRMIKKEESMWEKSTIAAKLSAIAYKSEKAAQADCKKLGFPSAKLISKDGAEVLVVKDRTDMWFAFRGTEPSKLNDVMADLKVVKNTAVAGGKVHGGFKQEVDDVWMDLLEELEHNDQLKVRKNVYFTGHSLGAAMATISATRYPPKELFTFGSPRVGGPRFIKNITCPHKRFMNNNDIVCRIPPAWLGFRHHGDMIYFNKDGIRQDKPTWNDFFAGVLQSWKRWKFFDGVVDHGMPNYVKALNKLKREK
jgi:triacylglycerol lipase